MKKDYKEVLAKIDSDIEDLVNRKILLEKFSHYEHYFRLLRKAVGRKSNTYIVELKKIAFKRLFKEGMMRQDITSILHLDHATLIFVLQNLDSNPKIYSEMEANFDDWISKGIYPYSISKKIRNEGDIAKKQKFRSELTYKLKELWP